MRVTVDLDDDLADECAARAPDLTWSQLVTEALAFALAAAADVEQHDQPNDE